MRLSYPPVFGVWLTMGCGSVIIDDNTGGSGGASVGATSSTKAASTSSLSTTTSGFTTSSTNGAGGNSAACDSAFINVVVNNAAPVQFTGSCPNSWGALSSSHPVAYFVSGGAVTGQLVVSGCFDSTLGSPRIDISGSAIDTVMPSVSPGVIFQYIDEAGQTWTPTPQEVGQIETSTMTGKSGDTVEGTFAGSVSFNGQIDMISGTFKACKVDNEDLP